MPPNRVALIGWPTAAVFDDGDTAEVIGLAADGTPDACPALLATAWRLSYRSGVLH